MKIKGFKNYIITGDGKVFSIRSNKFLSVSDSYDKDGKKRYFVTLSKNGKSYNKRISRLMAEAFIPNPLHLPQVDHINRISSDNRLENLRWVTMSQNNHNRGKFPHSTSPFKGVCYDKTNKRFLAYGVVNGKQKYIGVSKDEIVCAKKYNEWATKNLGEFAVLNDLVF